jgi:luciferase family oxidoreductase group 1
MTLALSVLDLAPVGSGGSAAEAVRRTVDLARLAERLGYVRHWFAEHHGMPSVASASPEVLIAHVAAHTRTIRVGSGGVMLPNHAPLRVAEAFRTLEALHPGRIDLGLGRAPGSNDNASKAMRAFSGDNFPAMLGELLTWAGVRRLPEGHPMGSLRAMPDDAALPPIWVLGSSGSSARMAAASGMGYAFASHFSPAPAAPVFAAYRDAFVASPAFARPHAILAMSVVCADTSAQAEYLAGALDLAMVQIRQGRFTVLPSPAEAVAYRFDDAEREIVRQFRSLAVVGAPESVRREIASRAAECQADEVMIVSNLHGHAQRLRSYELIARSFGALGAESRASSPGHAIDPPLGCSLARP